MKRVPFRSILCLAGLMTVALAGCNGSKEPEAGGGTSTSGGGRSTTTKTPATGKSRRIVFIFKVAGLGYGESCKQGAEKAAKDLGVSVEYLAPDKAEAGKQITMMEQLIAQKVDAIVISPNDAKAIIPVVKKAMAAGIKVFTWDSDSPESERVFYVAAADDVKIGVDIAEAIAKDIKGKGKVQIVSGGRGAENLNLHIKGFEEGFKKYPGIELVQPYIYNEDDNQKARSMAVTALARTPDIAAFACANSPSPPAVGEAITKLNKIGKLSVWGLALPNESKPYLNSGAISGVMLWDPSKLTWLTARLVNDYLDGKQPTDGAEFPEIGKISVKQGLVQMPGTTFTKENVGQYNF